MPAQDGEVDAATWIGSTRRNLAAARGTRADHLGPNTAVLTPTPDPSVLALAGPRRPEQPFLRKLHARQTTGGGTAIDGTPAGAYPGQAQDAGPPEEAPLLNVSRAATSWLAV